LSQAQIAKVLVTGASGVIGSCLTNHLRAKGYQVLLTDTSLQNGENYYRADIARFEETYEIFTQNKIDAVIHLAGEVGRLTGEMQPIRMIHVNEIGTLNLVKLCVSSKSRLLLVSTSEVYGNVSASRLREDLSDQLTLTPTNIYGISKLHAEQFVKHFASNYGLQAAIARPFMVYGPGERPGPFRSAMINFISSALSRAPLKVHRGAVRSWSYIDDIVEGLRLVLERADFTACPIFNLGRDDPRTMEEIARIIIEETCAPESLIQIVDPPEKFLSLVKLGDFSKAKDLLGFEAKTPVEEGIRRTVEWARSQLRI